LPYPDLLRKGRADKQTQTDISFEEEMCNKVSFLEESCSSYVTLRKSKNWKYLCRIKNVSMYQHSIARLFLDESVVSRVSHSDPLVDPSYHTCDACLVAAVTPNPRLPSRYWYATVPQGSPPGLFLLSCTVMSSQYHQFLSASFQSFLVHGCATGISSGTLPAL
jgi:hypothetical protein